MANSVAAFMDDPNWARFIPELKSGGERCRLPSHEDCASLEPDAIAAHLRPGGTLGTMKGYESRPGQLEMLRAVVQSYNDRTHLMVEAGTGVGKSLAYLLPSVHWASLNDTPVVVSTATRNLQSQLIASDIPRAVSTLGDQAASKFRVALLKGRTNYLCLKALEEMMSSGYYALSEEERREFERLHIWLQRTDSGDLDEFEGPLRQRLNCPGDECGGRGCKYYSRCFVTKARDRAAKAHLIVANHSLVLSEAVNAAATVLPAYGRLVFDEAHNLEDIATDFFSFVFSREELDRMFGRLERKGRRGRANGKKGLLGSVERQLSRGALATSSVAQDVIELVTKLRVQKTHVLSAAEPLFEVLKRLFSPAPKMPVVRYRRPVSDPPVPLQYSLHGVFTDYNPAQWSDEDLMVAFAKFEASVGAMVDLLMALMNALNEANGDEELPLFSDLVQQTVTLAESFRAFLVDAKFTMAGSDDSHAYWAEREYAAHPKKGESAERVKLVAAPLSVADKMNRYFYSLKDSVVLCSATLRVGDKFDYTGKRLGCGLAGPERVKSVVASSPFNYVLQSSVYAADFLPDPSSKADDYTAGLADLVVRLAKSSRGRALVLFTSYEMMNGAAERCGPQLDAAGIRLLVQGHGLSREEMVAELKLANEGVDGTPPTVLFGSQSFWEGVDVPGAALSLVIIARIPFPQVGEPIVEARSEKIEEAGGSSFRDYMMPEAVIKFRQGFGRLVRSKSDCGVVVIADPRVATKNYGAILKKSIPTSVHVVSSGDLLVSSVEEALS